MSIFDVLTLIGGLCLFLFGMNMMGKALEQRAGDSLRALLAKMTSGRLAGFAAGCGITAVIQSSSATTVMVVGFANSKLMSLRQAINVIMGANVGTTITAWILSLSGVSASSVWVQMLKPSSFVPVVALIGIIMYMMKGDETRKQTATILLAFATLMFGMETMSKAASGLAGLPGFQELFVAFENPLLGLLAGAVLTAVIQSSSAAIGILQVLAMTGQITYGAAIPIIMGSCIGTCVTAMISAIGTRRVAKQAAMAHLMFNVLGSVIWIIVFSIIKKTFDPAILSQPATLVGIAVVNTAFNVLTAMIFLPNAGILERIVLAVIPNKTEEEEVEHSDSVVDGEETGELPEPESELDMRLLVTPSLALERCEDMVKEMADCSVKTLKQAIQSLEDPSKELADEIRKSEERTDRIEDILGTYLIQLSGRDISSADNERVTVLMKVIGDYERIADHGVNILEAAEEMKEKELCFTKDASRELRVMTGAVSEVVDLANDAFLDTDLTKADQVEPLEQVIDELKEKLRTKHIIRMKEGRCGVDAGFVWSDLLTDLERCSDHCSNIAGCIIDFAAHTGNIHETLRKRQDSAVFESMYLQYVQKYAV